MVHSVADLGTVYAVAVKVRFSVAELVFAVFESYVPDVAVESAVLLKVVDCSILVSLYLSAMFDCSIPPAD